MDGVYRIAIIDDSKEFIFLIKTILERTDLFTAECDGYSEVSKYDDSKKYDLILTDLRLNETYGVDTILKLKEKTKNVIVVLTALGGSLMTESDAQIFIDAGASAVIGKDEVGKPGFLEKIKTIADTVRISGHGC